MKLQQKLAGPRVAIRNYEKSDLNFVTGMWLDEENGRYLSDPTAAYVDERFQRALDTLQDEREGGYFIIETADTAQRIGSCSAFPGETAGEYDIGYCIHKACWRRGYGREAVALLLDWLRTQGAQRVTAEAAVENKASCALLRSLGFKEEKKSSFRKYRMDVSYDSVIYALLPENWPEP